MSCTSGWEFLAIEAGQGLWYPTHFAKNMKWMGHPAFLEQPSNSRTTQHFSYNIRLEQSCPMRLWQGVCLDRTIYSPGDGPHLE